MVSGFAGLHRQKKRKHAQSVFALLSINCLRGIVDHVAGQVARIVRSLYEDVTVFSGSVTGLVNVVRAAGVQKDGFTESR